MIFRRENRLILCYYSKNIHNFIHKYLTWDANKRKSHTIRLKNHNHSMRFKVGFLRGCLDSDGYLSNQKINFATSSLKLAKDINDFLMHLNIKFSYSVYKEKRPNRVNMHHTDIGKNQRNQFLSIIEPRETKNLNAPAGIRNSETAH